ncbi:MAG: hypothetical protein K2Q06_02895, partial [Parvularculaceae bacterium]|nr:hypothetical protein [Parvularculaceae bacterium]
SRLYTDWRRRDRAHIYADAPRLDADYIHACAFDLLKCGPHLGAALRMQATAPIRSAPDAAFAAPFDPGSAAAAFARDGVEIAPTRLDHSCESWGPLLARL